MLASSTSILIVLILDSLIANCDALVGNLAPRDVTFGGLAYAGTAAGIDAVPGGSYI